MSARGELDAARSILAQLDPARGPDKARADLIAVWGAIEAALRSLVGGSTSGGQALVRDARSRQMLSFDQANALAAFLSVREQLDRPEYVPTEADANAARSAFLKLDAGLMSAPAAGTAAPSPYAPGSASIPYVATPTATSVPVSATVQPPPPGMQPLARPRRRLWIPILAVLLIVAAIPVLMLTVFKRGDDTMAQGIRAYQSGQRETAASNFERAARANPSSALPHVYLSRMAREVGNYTVANQELQLALKAEPASLDGRREYGSLFLAQGNYDQARIWYTHALETSPNDLASQGWLGCSLVKLGRTDEGLRWLGRAGNGAWSACRNAAVTTAPGVLPP